MADIAEKVPRFPEWFEELFDSWEPHPARSDCFWVAPCPACKERFGATVPEGSLNVLVACPHCGAAVSFAAFYLATHDATMRFVALAKSGM